MYDRDIRAHYKGEDRLGSTDHIVIVEQYSEHRKENPWQVITCLFCFNEATGRQLATAITAYGKRGVYLEDKEDV